MYTPEVNVLLLDVWLNINSLEVSEICLIYAIPKIIHRDLSETISGFNS